MHAVSSFFHSSASFDDESCQFNGTDANLTKSDSDNQDDHLQTVVEIVAARTTIGTGRVIPLIHTCSS